MHAGPPLPAQAHHRPNSQSLLGVRTYQSPQAFFDGRRPSQLSEIESLVTVAEYLGTQYETAQANQNTFRRQSGQLENSAAKTQLQNEGTIGSLGSEIQILSDKKQRGDAVNQNGEKVLMFRHEADDMGELTSLSEMEMSNVQDASLIQLERDLVETQQKLHEQSQKTQAFAKVQQNNLFDLKQSLKAEAEKHVIFEDTEEAEDDIAQLLPKKRGAFPKGLKQVPSATAMEEDPAQSLFKPAHQKRLAQQAFE